MNNFFTFLYEGFHPLDLFYISNFSDDMHQTETAYVTIGIIMIFSSIILESAYYYVISNYGSFYKRKFWFLWLVIIALINFFMAYHFSVATLQDYYSTLSIPYPYTFTEHFTFSMVNVFWTVVFCFIFSVILKFKSIQASRTPF